MVTLIPAWIITKQIYHKVWGELLINSQASMVQVSIQVILDDFCPFSLWFRFVAVSVCGLFSLWPFRFVAVSVCGLFSLWPLRFMAVPVCGRFGLWPFRSVTVSVYGRSGFGRFDL